MCAPHSNPFGLIQTHARVSSHDQKDDLERQKQVLELYCARQGWTFEVIAELGSGMNYRKKGLKRLLDSIIDDQVGRLVIAHTDRLLRFGAELVFAICEAKGVEMVILNQGEDSTAPTRAVLSDCVRGVVSARPRGAAPPLETPPCFARRASSRFGLREPSRADRRTDREEAMLLSSHQTERHLANTTWPQRRGRCR